MKYKNLTKGFCLEVSEKIALNVILYCLKKHDKYQIK